MKTLLTILYSLIMSFLLFFTYTSIWGLAATIAFLFIVDYIIEKGKLTQ